MASREASPPPAPATVTNTTVTIPVTSSKYSNRVLLRTILERSDGGLGLVGERVVVGGWVKSSKEERKEAPPPPAEEKAAAAAERKDVTCVELFQAKIPMLRTIIKVFGGGSQSVRQKIESAVVAKPQTSIAVLKVGDGSCVATLQVVVDSFLALPSQLLPTGTCVLVEGILTQPQTPGKQTLELKVEKILHIGTADHDSYILSKKRLPLDVLRNSLHFRPRTTTVASVMRIRSSLTLASHTFFHDHGFIEVQVPIITTMDSEGSSQKFYVTVLPRKAGQTGDGEVINGNAGVSLETIKAAAREKSKLVDEFKRTESNKEALSAALHDLAKTNELASQLEAKERPKPGASEKANEANLTKDFFPSETYLTVSGQLHLESYACALGQVYSFGPRFRADRTESLKLAAEMWMVEVEMAFSDLEDAMNCADDFFKFCCKSILDNCSEDIKFVSKRIDKAIIDRLQSVLSKSSVRITYSEAVEALKKAEKKTETKVEWGYALTTEHLSYLADEIFKSPVIIYNYPKEVKPFYVRVNDDGKTVAAFDMVVPKVGKLITGSQSEERMSSLIERIKEMGLSREQYEWYLDLRKHGTVKHSGFSFGFDLMVLFATGLTDVRDVIPFPRSFGKASC